LDGFDGYVVFDGGGAAVFELGGGVEDFAVAGTDLDADVAVGCGDGGVGAVEAGAALVVDANAEGAGFAEEELFEGGDVVVVGEDGDEGAEAAFLHLDGGGHDVECALLEGGFGDVGEDLGAEVVDGGFEDGDGAVGGVDGVADVEAEDVGEVFGVAGSGAVADVLDAHGWLGGEGGREGADDGCAGGCDELFLDVCGVGGKAAEEVGGGGGGDGEAAVGAVDHASAYVEGGGEPLVDGEGVDAGAGGYDVDDGIDCAYFVEVDFFDVDVVDFGFAGAEELEGVDCEGFDCGDEVGGIDEGADCGEGTAVSVLMGMIVLLIMMLVVVILAVVIVSVAVAYLVFVLGLGMVPVGLGVLVGGIGCGFGQLCAFEDVDFGGGDSAAVYFFDLEGCA